MGACDQDARARSVHLPPTQVLTIRPHWAVVTRTYARVFAERDPAGDIVFHVRAGDVVSLDRVDAGGLHGEWFFIGMGDLQGWIPADTLELYDTRSRAQSASEIYRVAPARDDERD
jgi:hypothetical protein